MKRYDLVDITYAANHDMSLFCTDQETLAWMTAEIHRLRPKATLEPRSSLLVILHPERSFVSGLIDPMPLVMTLLEELCHRGWEPIATEPWWPGRWNSTCRWTLKYTHELSAP